MEKEEEIIKIPYLPYISYSQIQAEILGLTHTEAILMNYFAYYLPNYGTCKVFNGRNYYWMNYNKIFSDMPTLDFSVSTLRRYINKFIKDKILEREVHTEHGSLSRAFYRATQNYLGKKPETPFNFTTLYNNIESLIEEGSLYSGEKDKLIKLLLSYKGKKIKPITTYNLDGVEGTDILNYLRDEFILSEKGEGIIIDIGKEINFDYIEKEIVNIIIENGKDYGWIKPKVNGKGLDVNNEVKGKILGNLKKMFQWLKDKKKPVKSWNGNIRTWFGKSRI